MSDLAQRLAGLSPVQRQLLEKRLAKTRPATPEPIAIVGMACRFPGAPNLDAYWRLIHDGLSAVTEVPSDRWNVDEFYDPTGDTPGRMSVRWAALVENPDQFDPQFFGITPREAVRMDPQQRLLLEVAWETMENAGLPADKLAGSRTGVLIGIGSTDYTKVCVPYEDYYQQIDAHLGTGNALSIAANRLSYIFDFHGPSAAVDTACSSSSLAIHLAVESLRRGESDAALAGGVNMILTPETTIAFSKARMLSPEGICRPFDSRANGYVRGEGCGLVLLKRLSDAQRDGDRIFAVLRATSVNQDGRTSGISAPNGQSQIACIRAALTQAGLSPADIDYVEAHGTGTPLGDPIEIQALAEIFHTAEDSAKPCYVASVKANVGHMETVSGVAGLIKVVLLMQHDQIARQTHFEKLNPHMNLSGSRLAIPAGHVAWPRGERPRIAGVSSFGFGGTNTHLIVEAPAADDFVTQHSTELDRPIQLLKLSAKSDAALKQQARDLAEFLQREQNASIGDVCWSANTGRSEFNFRAAVIAKDRDELLQRLNSFADGEAAVVAGVKQATVRTIGRPKVAFLCTGQGSQYVGMGRRLYETQPVFRDVLNKCDAILRQIWGGQSLLDVLYPSADSASTEASQRLHQTQYTQPALFALEYALAQQWASWGIVPDIVLGHSVGEYAAACIASAMSLEDGLALIAERARLMQSVKRHGKMAVIFASPQRVAAAVAPTNGAVVVAVINGPENTVISGEAEAVDKLAARFVADGVQVTPLNVSHAFHSPLMDEMLDEFERYAAGIQFHEPRIPLAANLTGQLMTTAPTARYWRDHLRNAVQFAEGMNRVAEVSPAIIIEIGPTASLLGMGRRCSPNLEAAWLPSLREGQDDWQVIIASVAEYYVRGGQVDWRGWDRPWQRRQLLLPTYPFQRSRHWFPVDPAKRRLFSDNGDSDSAARIVSVDGKAHALLGAQLSTVWSNRLFEARISARSPAYLIDHQVQGSPVMPAAAYVEQALAAAEQVFGAGRHGVSNLVIQQAMFLTEGTRRRVQISVAPEAGGEATLECYSQPVDDQKKTMPWTMHATGSLVHESTSIANDPPSIVDLREVRNSAVTTSNRDDFYAKMRDRGLNYGPAFQVLDEMHRGTADALARVDLPDSVRRELDHYHLHPSLGDALLQMMAGAVPLEEDGSFSPFTYMPVGIRAVRVFAGNEEFQKPLFGYASRTSNDASPSPERVEANIHLLDEQGKVLVSLEGVQVQRVGRGSSGDITTDTSRWLYQVAWHEAPLPEVEVAGRSGAWLIFADAHGLGSQLAAQLAERGESSILVRPGQRLKITTAAASNGGPGLPVQATLDPRDERHFAELLTTEFKAKSCDCLGIVHLWSLDVPRPDVSKSRSDAWQDEQRIILGSALQLIRALTRATLAGSPSLWLATAGAQAIPGAGSAGDARLAAEQSPLLGFGRVAAMELPDLRPRLVDLDNSLWPLPVQDAAAVLVKEVLAISSESEIAYRNGRRYVARLVPAPTLLGNSSTAAAEKLVIPRGSFQLRITQAGSLDALRFAPVDRGPPAAGQVEIQVHATGLNFSDVLKALGLYPGIKDAIVPLGIEASGVVTAIGPGVDRFGVGDEVFGVVPYAFASHARTAEYALVHKPKSIGHEEACTIPITFLTAYYGLVRLAQLQPSEQVLIHAGAGGVGLAAIQIAQQIGAKVYCTAGSEVKRAFLRSLGVEHVYSSRSTAFADEILTDTNREGVDVVLNSLPGEAITKSLSILRAYGRFLEIGKTDIYQNRMIGLLPFQDNLSYFAIDLDRMLRQRPDYIRELFAEVMQHFESKSYRPLEFTHFDAPSTIEAFRYMSQRKNIGKVVVSMVSQESRVESQEPEKADGEAALIRRDGTYLITGGLGALGLRVANWLAEQGAGAIALLSRRDPSAESETALAAIRERGAKVVVLSGDVADDKSLAGALAQIPQDALPLRGVIHAAGVLDDGILADMTLEQLDRPLSPKVRGAWNLHAATLNQPLDFFVMFSSVASVLGSPGQANYAAGNAYLDALAHTRRAEGLPATAINWGPWAGSGMAAEAGRGEQVKSRGILPIDPRNGLDLLEKILLANLTQVVVMDVQWADMLRLLGSRRPALLSTIAAEVDQSDGSQTESHVDHAFRKKLLEADDRTRQSLVADYIRQELARIMGVEPATLVADQPLSTFGLDSLLALELKNNLENRLDFTLPMAKLMEGPSIASLAEETSRLLSGGTAAETSEQLVTRAEHSDDVWSPLLTLRSTGDQPPLILLPALGGDIRCYAELVQQLGDDQPVYVFRPRGVDQAIPPHLTIEEMMDDYLAALKELQPTGPYYLAGWSMAGIFAFALAEAIERSGGEIALLALFDTPYVSICDDIDVEDDAHFLSDLLTYANRFAGTDVKLSYDLLTSASPEQRFQAALGEARRQGLIPAEAPEAYIRRLVKVGETNVRVIQSYRPKAIETPVILFLPTTKTALAEVSGGRTRTEIDHGWSVETGQKVVLEEIPGDHFTMMTTDGANCLARALSHRIALASQSNVAAGTGSRQ